MNRKITCIIVDDDESAIQHLRNIAKVFVVELIIVQTFTNPIAALKFLKKKHVDFVLLDVEMPELDGVAFAMQIPKEVRVVFCTNHKQYAADGYDHEVLDFLQKPVSTERFYKMLTRVRSYLKRKVGETEIVPDDYYYFIIKGPMKSERTKLLFNEIVYIEAREGHIHFHLISDLALYEAQLSLGAKQADAATAEAKDKKSSGPKGLCSNMTLQEVMNIVQGSSFMQIQKGYVLNTKYFRTIAKRTVTLVGLQQITLQTGERANFPEFFDWIENHRGPGN